MLIADLNGLLQFIYGLLGAPFAGRPFCFAKVSLPLPFLTLYSVTANDTIMYDNNYETSLVMVNWIGGIYFDISRSSGKNWYKIMVGCRELAPRFFWRSKNEFRLFWRNSACGCSCESMSWHWRFTFSDNTFEFIFVCVFGCRLTIFNRKMLNSRNSSIAQFQRRCVLQQLWTSETWSWRKNSKMLTWWLSNCRVRKIRSLLQLIVM